MSSSIQQFFHLPKPTQLHAGVSLALSRDRNIRAFCILKLDVFGTIESPYKSYLRLADTGALNLTAFFGSFGSASRSTASWQCGALGATRTAGGISVERAWPRRSRASSSSNSMMCLLTMRLVSELDQNPIHCCVVRSYVLSRNFDVVKPESRGSPSLDVVGTWKTLPTRCAMYSLPCGYTDRQSFTKPLLTHSGLSSYARRRIGDVVL